MSSTMNRKIARYLRHCSTRSLYHLAQHRHDLPLQAADIGIDLVQRARRLVLAVVLQFV